jgi:hypothetical protein
MPTRHPIPSKLSQTQYSTPIDTQALLEEALDLLFLKKGRGKIIGT